MGRRALISNIHLNYLLRWAPRRGGGGEHRPFISAPLSPRAPPAAGAPEGSEARTTPAIYARRRGRVGTY